MSNRDLLPLTPRVFLLLWALEAGPMHGYGILSEIESLGRRQVTFGPASLYDAIQTLRKRGLIAPAEPPADAEGDDRRRRYFELTEAGRQLLGAEVVRLAHLVEDLRTAGLVDSMKTR